MDEPRREYILSSGNILSKSISWRKGNEAPDDEIYESLKSCLEGQEDRSIKNGDVYEIVGEDLKNNNEEVVDRQELKVSLKVFLYSSKKEDIIAAVEKGLKHASADYVDTLVVTHSGGSDGIPLSLETVQATWTTLEEMVKDGKVKVIGLSDVDTQLFIQLHTWARVKPQVIQINLASCCVVPPELSEFCKDQGIQLLTHSDPMNALSEDKLAALTSTLLNRKEKPAPWDLVWVLRYQVHLKCRGVLATKGYVASLIEKL